MDRTLSLAAGEKTDYFIDALNNHRIANASVHTEAVMGDFVISARVKPVFGKDYDAGFLFGYQDDEHWIKVAFELTDLGHTAAVTVVTDGLSDDANGEKLEIAELWLQLSRCGDYWGAHYSIDGEDWRMIRYCPLKLAGTIQVGVGVQSPAGPGCEAVFSDIAIRSYDLKSLRSGK